MYAMTAIKAIGKIIIANGINIIPIIERRKIPQQHHKKNVKLDILSNPLNFGILNYFNLEILACFVN